MSTLSRRVHKRVRRLASPAVEYLKTLAPPPPIAWPAAGRRASDGAPVFVVGCPASGVEVLASLLDRHSRLACTGETWYLAGLLEQLRNRYYVLGLRDLGVSPLEVAQNIRGYALLYYERFLRRAGKARWVDTTSEYVEYCAELATVFGPAVRIVHVVRHGFDVVDALQDLRRLQLAPEPPLLGPTARLESSARQWVRALDGFERFAARFPTSCHSIRIEDLAADPERTLRSVVAFLGEPWEPAMLAGERPHPLVGGGYQTWSPGQRTAVAAILAAQLDKCGYAIPLQELARTSA